MSEPFLIGLVGARGATGRELIRLIAGHPELMLAYAVSREFAGRPVVEVAPEDQDECIFEALSPEEAAGRRTDAVILALPDGSGADYVAAIEKYASHRIVIDLRAPAWNRLPGVAAGAGLVAVICMALWASPLHTEYNEYLTMTQRTSTYRASPV